MFSQISKTRLLLIDLAILAVFPLLIYQIFRLTVQNQDFLQDFANRQHNLVIEIEPERGQILDRNLKELASNLKVPSIYAVPRAIRRQDRAGLATKIAKILGLNRSFVLERLTRDKAFVWLKRRTTMREA